MAYFLSPLGNTQTIDANGNPLVGGTISTFLAGTSTAATTYTDDTGGTGQGVVMTLNANGYPENGPVWMLGGQPLKFIIKNAAGVTQSTFDDISGIGDTSSTVDEWLVYGLPPTYISATSFSVTGDQTNTFQANRRLKSTNSGGTTYSEIFSSSFGAGVTTVTVVNTSGVLDAGLSSVSYSFLAATNPSVPAIYAKKSEIQASTYTAFPTTGTSTAFVVTPLPALTANTANTTLDITFHVAPTGTPTMAASGLAALPLKYRDRAGALQTLTGAQAPINWKSPVYTDGTNWIVLVVAAVPFNSIVRVQVANGYGSTNNKIMRFTNIITNTGGDITYADSAANGGSFTCVNPGTYAISYTSSFSASGDMGISLNSTQLTTAITLITAADQLCESLTSAANAASCVGVTIPLVAGDVIRAHTDGLSAGSRMAMFSIARVS